MKKIITYLVVMGFFSILTPLYSQSFAKQGVFIDSSGSLMKGTARGWALKTDAAGNIYFTGTYQEAVNQGFLRFNSAFLPISPGEANMCVLKLNSSGTVLWSKSFIALKESGLIGSDLALDNNGNIFVTGLFAKTVDFNPDAGVANLTSTGAGKNVFLLKLKNDGSFEWVKHLRAASADGESFLSPAVATTSDAGVLVAGSYKGKIDLNPSLLLNIATSQGNNDIFIVRLSSNGSHVWSKTIGGQNIGGEMAFGDTCSDIIVDRDKKIWLTGSFWGTVDFNPNAGVNNLTVGGSYVLKLDENANFIWAKKFTGGVPYEIGLDQNLNVYVTGSFKNTVDFDPAAGIFNLEAGNNVLTFATSLNNSGSFRWAKKLGSEGSMVFPSSLAVNSSGVYLTGAFTHTADFNPDAGIFNLVSAGKDDIYLTKLSTSLGTMQWAKRIGSQSDEAGLGIALDLGGNLISIGYFTGKVDFDPNAGALFLDSSLPSDHTQIYVLKMKTDGSL